MEHSFKGKWITDREFADLEARNVFHRQLEPMKLDTTEHRNRHILFRKKITLQGSFQKATLYVTADDYAKVYINGKFVSQGPAPAYHFQYGYQAVDVTAFLHTGENTLAFHTYYQGLINRVWVSGDRRHGLLCDLVVDGKIVAASGEDFLTHPHTGLRELGTTGYETQFMEEYDAASPEVGFEQPEFDDSRWEAASLRRYTDYKMVEQKSKSLFFEEIRPIEILETADGLRFDFGKTYVGTLSCKLMGKKGEKVELFYGQELEGEEVRWHLRANCAYHDSILLSGGKDRLEQFDYKSFRYVKVLLPKGCEMENMTLNARHYPFELLVGMKPAYREDEELRKIWELGVNSLKYGVQEVIQDCMEREKGFYVGDGCYTSLAHFILSGDDSILRKLIDDAWASSFITPGLVTCLDCAFMQEIAEYPLIMISLVLWHYRLTGDKIYLAKNYPHVCALLEEYRKLYERDNLIGNLDKWCVVDWPDNFRDGYDVDITEGKICTEPHVVLNAYYIEAIRVTNQMSEILGKAVYRDIEPFKEAFMRTFYDEKAGLFRDSAATKHISYIGNVFPFAFGFFPKEALGRMIAWIREKGIEGVSFFGAFVLLEGLIREGREDLVREQISREGAWKRMLREGATTTYEGWGRDTKWNTSLFHLTMSDVVVFLSDIDLKRLFE